tara:strand:+ start:1271 stop:1441 length:171 start_codon:yes stop_codon:yes gene_type:complete
MQNDDREGSDWKIYTDCKPTTQNGHGPSIYEAKRYISDSEIIKVGGEKVKRIERNV